MEESSVYILSCIKEDACTKNVYIAVFSDEFIQNSFDGSYS